MNITAEQVSALADQAAQDVLARMDRLRELASEEEDVRIGWQDIEQWVRDAVLGALAEALRLVAEAEKEVHRG